MQPMQHQMMGYDRAITMFSPDGRLLQVEYAKKTVKQGSTAIGIQCVDGVLLLTDKRIMDKMVIPDSVEKIFQIDEHIAATASGIISDARVLIDRAQVKAQQHAVTYGSSIDLLSVVKDICDLKQICTQSGGLRPFGVSLLIAGVDNDVPKLYETDPIGIYFQYKAAVIGEGEVEIEEQLQKEYKEDITIDDALKLGIKAMKNTLDDNFNMARVEAVAIRIKDRLFSPIERGQLDKVFKEIQK